MLNSKKLIITLKYLTFLLLFTKSHYLDYFTPLERDIKIEMLDYETKNLLTEIPKLESFFS